MKLWLKVILYIVCLTIVGAQIDDNDAAEGQFRTVAPPLFGMIGLALGVAAVVYFGLKNDNSFLGDLRGEKYLNILRIVLYAGCSILTFSGMFFFFSYLWFEGYQLVLFSLFGVYAVWSMNKIYILIVSENSKKIISFTKRIINNLEKFLGYNNPIAEQSPNICLQYFRLGSGLSSRCSSSGLLNWLRFLGLSCIIIQPIVAYVTFILYRHLTRGDSQSASSDGSYGVIKNEPQVSGTTSEQSYHQTTYQSNKDSVQYI